MFVDVVFAEGMSTRRDRDRQVRGERRGDKEDVCVERDRERVVKRVYV